MLNTVYTDNTLLKTIFPKMDHLASDNLYLKIADTPQEIISAQQLRYQVFYQEIGAIPTEEMRTLGRDIDPYDPFCHHLLVIDSNDQKVIGTYRILSLDEATNHGITLYTESEFDLSKLKATGKRIMEVSRSCVLLEYRNRKAINLLWQGIADMVIANKIDYLVGTPSLHGIDITEHAQALSYLQAFHMAPEEIRPHTIKNHYQALPIRDKESIDIKREFVKLPPLLKGYLRLGAVIGDGAFIDYQFNTVDVVIIVPIETIDSRYQHHYLHKDEN